jgi:hypothetical protein
MLKVIQEVSAQNPRAKELNVDQLIETRVVRDLEQVYARA